MSTVYTLRQGASTRGIHYWSTMENCPRKNRLSAELKARNQKGDDEDDELSASQVSNPKFALGIAFHAWCDHYFSTQNAVPWKDFLIVDAKGNPVESDICDKRMPFIVEALSNMWKPNHFGKVVGTEVEVRAPKGLLPVSMLEQGLITEEEYECPLTGFIDLVTYLEPDDCDRLNDLYSTAGTEKDNGLPVNFIPGFMVWDYKSMEYVSGMRMHLSGKTPYQLNGYQYMAAHVPSIVAPSAGIIGMAHGKGVVPNVNVGVFTGDMFEFDTFEARLRSYIYKRAILRHYGNDEADISQCFDRFGGKLCYFAGKACDRR